MAYKTLIFGTDELFGKLQPHYEKAAQDGILDIIATATISNDVVDIVYSDGKRGG